MKHGCFLIKESNEASSHSFYFKVLSRAQVVWVAWAFFVFSTNITWVVKTVPAMETALCGAHLETLHGSMTPANIFIFSRHCIVTDFLTACLDFLHYGIAICSGISRNGFRWSKERLQLPSATDHLKEQSDLRNNNKMLEMILHSMHSHLECPSNH